MNTRFDGEPLVFFMLDQDEEAAPLGVDLPRFIVCLHGAERWTDQRASEDVGLLARLRFAGKNRGQSDQVGTCGDDLFTRRLRPSAGYLMTAMLLIDQIGFLYGRERFFDSAMTVGYFALMGVYVAGRSIEKSTRKSLP